MEKRDSVRGILRGGALMGDVRFDEPMKNHTTLRIGGPAEVFVMPKDAVSIRNVLAEAEAGKLPVTAVGGGSNLLVADEGIGGVIVTLSLLDRIEVIRDTDDEVRLFVESGAPLQRVVHLAGEKGYAGIEGLAGIPGSIGGAIKGNSGSFGYEIGSVVESITVINVHGALSILNRDTLNPGYRSAAVPDDCLILSAKLKLQKDGVDEVAKRVSRFLGEKRTKQPISTLSAGSVFKNPEGTHAGELIDNTGCKGMKRGAIEVSRLHANFFVNTGEGRASDFLALMEDVKQRVFKAYGVELDPEIKIVGRSFAYGNR